MGLNIKSVFDKLTEKVGSLIVQYRDDLLVHDRDAIGRNPGVPFLHWARAGGTEIQFLVPADSEMYPKDGERAPYLFGERDRYGLANVPVEVALYLVASDVLACHWFDGETLHEVSVTRAVEIARQHKNAVCAVWQCHLAGAIAA